MVLRRSGDSWRRGSQVSKAARGVRTGRSGARWPSCRDVLTIAPAVLVRRITSSTGCPLDAHRPKVIGSIRDPPAQPQTPVGSMAVLAGRPSRQLTTGLGRPDFHAGSRCPTPIGLSPCPTAGVLQPGPLGVGGRGTCQSLGPSGEVARADRPRSTKGAPSRGVTLPGRQRSAARASRSRRDRDALSGLARSAPLQRTRPAEAREISPCRSGQCE